MTNKNKAMDAVPKGTHKRVLLASLTGSSIEWFDFFLYATTAALVFNKLFSPLMTQW